MRHGRTTGAEKEREDLDAEEDAQAVGASGGRRVRAGASVPRELIRIVYRDPSTYPSG